MWPPHPKSSLSYFVRKNSLQYVEENENLNLGNKNNILFMNGWMIILKVLFQLDKEPTGNNKSAGVAG